MIRKKGKEIQRQIALERIKILFGLAEKVALQEEDLELANNYVKKARAIAMRCNARIPSMLKRKFCKFCHIYLLPGRTSKVRINSAKKRVSVQCLNCKREMYFPYVREIKEKRRRKSS
ncbi:MAG: ribonuclease P [Candidatus Altiarchaeota archaeon]